MMSPLVHQIVDFCFLFTECFGIILNRSLIVGKIGTSQYCILVNRIALNDIMENETRRVCFFPFMPFIIYFTCILPQEVLLVNEKVIDTTSLFLLVLTFTTTLIGILVVCLISPKPSGMIILLQILQLNPKRVCSNLYFFEDVSIMSS